MKRVIVAVSVSLFFLISNSHANNLFNYTVHGGWELDERVPVIVRLNNESDTSQEKEVKENKQTIKTSGMNLFNYSVHGGWKLDVDNPTEE